MPKEGFDRAAEVDFVSALRATIAYLEFGRPFNEVFPPENVQLVVDSASKSTTAVMARMVAVVDIAEAIASRLNQEENADIGAELLTELQNTSSFASTAIEAIATPIVSTVTMPSPPPSTPAPSPSLPMPSAMVPGTTSSDDDEGEEYENGNRNQADAPVPSTSSPSSSLLQQSGTTGEHSLPWWAYLLFAVLGAVLLVACCIYGSPIIRGMRKQFSMEANNIAYATAPGAAARLPLQVHVHSELTWLRMRARNRLPDASADVLLSDARATRHFAGHTSAALWQLVYTADNGILESEAPVAVSDAVLSESAELTWLRLRAQARRPDASTDSLLRDARITTHFANHTGNALAQLVYGSMTSACAPAHTESSPLISSDRDVEPLKRTLSMEKSMERVRALHV